MRKLKIGSDQLIRALLAQPGVCLLDSCGDGYMDSHRLIAGILPTDVTEISGDPDTILAAFDRLTHNGGRAGIFTLSYDLGRKMVIGGPDRPDHASEPGLFYAEFDCLVIYDYRTQEAFLTGNEAAFDETEHALLGSAFIPKPVSTASPAISDHTRGEYIEAVESIRESIRSGFTYQTNLTQQLKVRMADNDTPADIFFRLRAEHPAAFSAYVTRGDSVVVSASPERFFTVDRQGGRISASPIKGTRPRGATEEIDRRLRNELLMSEKDRAENSMIVDLLRNDLGRVCRYGSVRVDKLCEIEEHPTLFHLTSTISGELRNDVGSSDLIRALFPCGSITGAPKIRTMEIIDEIERSPRGLSMGSIGCSIPDTGFAGPKPGLDLNVAIRTMVIQGDIATFNVGGGIVIDSDPAAEYDESLLKAKALLTALGSCFDPR